MTTPQREDWKQVNPAAWDAAITAAAQACNAIADANLVDGSKHPVAHDCAVAVAMLHSERWRR